VNTLAEWVDLVCRELEITAVTSPAAMQSRVLDLSRDVAHNVARPAAPLTAYLLGLAAGRSSDPEATADRLAQQLGLLAQRWHDEQDPSS
jgi:uncharacterized protein DUF6457